MRRDKEEFDRAGMQVLLVSMGSPSEAEAFRREFGIPFAMVCDPDQTLYRAYNLKRGTLGTLASPRLFLQSVRALAHGHLPGVPHGDVMQMPGAFVIDRKGVVRYQHYSSDAADYPSAEEMLRSVRE